MKKFLAWVATVAVLVPLVVWGGSVKTRSYIDTDFADIDATTLGSPVFSELIETGLNDQPAMYGWVEISLASFDSTGMGAGPQGNVRVQILGYPSDYLKGAKSATILTNDGTPIGWGVATKVTSNLNSTIFASGYEFADSTIGIWIASSWGTTNSFSHLPLPPKIGFRFSSTFGTWNAGTVDVKKVVLYN